MVSKQEQSVSSHHSDSPTLIPFRLLSPFEMDVPQELEALGSRLTVRIRMAPIAATPLHRNGSRIHQVEGGINTEGNYYYLQLGMYEETGDLFILTQQRTQAITTNWQDVNFDCGWLVKGGRYFVHLLQAEQDLSPDVHTSPRPPSLSRPIPHPAAAASNFTQRLNNDKLLPNHRQHAGGRDVSGLEGVHLLAAKTLIVTYPTILFEVPTRLETYTTAAPVTFGLTRTICKPKLNLPPTLLTLTSCSPTTSGPSSSSSASFSANTYHFSSSSSHSTRLGGDDGSHNRDHHHRHPNPPPNHHSSSSSSWSSSSRPKNPYNSTSDDIHANPKDELETGGLECHRDVRVIFQDPLAALQTEGRVTINVECQLWGRNATYVIQLREADSNYVIAQSSFIKVEWSSQFSLKLSRSSILRCQGSIRVLVTHPQCILPGRDKIRIYGYETLPVPSFLAPKRVSYIGEQQIRENNRILSFRCEMFPPRFLRFCFHYVNTAVDDSVAVVVEKCIPTGPASKISDGGWSSWSKWSSCSVTCGSGGKRFRYRFCDSPPPTSGANFCQGKAIQEEPCESDTPCPPPLHSRRQPFLTQSQLQPSSRRKGNESSQLLPRGDPERLGKAGAGLVGLGRRTESLSERPSFMDFSVLNVSTTPGCECGCILYDLVPTKNYSLVILISANQSSCADEDEEDHHNFRWILHARNEKDRIRLDIVGMDVQCVTMTFRDGNTTDSNLLEVITASQPSDPIQFEGFYERELGQRSGSPSQPHPSSQQQQYHYEEDYREEDDLSAVESEEYIANRESGDLLGDAAPETEDDTKGSSTSTISILRIESTGSSLSIGTTTDSSKNCSGQFIYFIAYYTTIPDLVPGVAERKEEKLSYDFWSFLVVKLLVLFFISIVALSTFAGCFTKMYAKYKYKELKCFELEEEEAGSLNEESDPSTPRRRKNRRNNDSGLDDASRSTSITLMSFDYGYWRRLRLLRLKYFLLRPRPLDPITTKTKSFPNTPTVSTRDPSTSNKRCSGNNPSKKLVTSVTRAEKIGGNGRPSIALSKPISFSESNLREKVAVLALTEDGYEVRRTGWSKESGERNAGGAEGDSTSGPVRGAHSDERGSVSLASTSVSISISQSLNGSETNSSGNSFHTPTPTPTPTPSIKPDDRGEKKDSGKFVKGGGGIKLLKEQENLKRKAVGTSVTPSSMSGSEKSHSGRALLKKLVREEPKGGKRTTRAKKRILQHGDSTASVSTVQSGGVSVSTTGDEDSSRVASRTELEDTDQDFEMDYYDYDVGNAGNIPGSFLGLEPAFVLWNSDVYPNSDEEGEDREEDEGQGSSRVGAGSHLSGSTKGYLDDGGDGDGIEMTTPNSHSIGIYSQGTSSSQEFGGVKETSLDTLKFADEDDDEDDMESYAESIDSLPKKNK